MLARRLRTIAQLPEPRRYAVLAEGLDLLAENVATLEIDASTLGDARRHRSAAVLRCFADEEAAKVLILMDLARAGWSDVDAVDVCLSAFYNHLARGLYVKAYDGSPADLSEVRRYVDFWRQQYYLDGPTDVDWIFGNEVLAGREQRLYVDYIEDEDGSRSWTGPADRAAAFDEPYEFPAPMSVVVQLVAAMRRVGLLSEEGLVATSAVWDGVRVQDSMHFLDLYPLNVATIEKLDASGSESATAEAIEAARYVCDRWIFPLTCFELSIAKVDPADLKREREQWLARETGAFGEIVGE